MAEQDEITLDDESIALEDVEESAVSDVDVSGIIDITMRKDG